MKSSWIEGPATKRETFCPLMSRSSAAPVSITTSSYLEAMVDICLAKRLAVQRCRVQPREPERGAYLHPEAGTSPPVGVNEQHSLSHATLLGEQCDDHSVP